MLNLTNFKAYLAKPTNVRFETQQEGEEIVLLLRRHFITNISWVVLGLVLLALPFLASPLAQLVQVSLSDYLSTQHLFLVTLFYYLLILGYLLEQFLLWYFSVNIVTDTRLVDVDFTGLLSKVVSEARMSDIQDISIKTTGALALTFNFGDLTVQTQGSEPTVEFEDIPDPAGVQKIISALVQEAKNGGTN